MANALQKYVGFFIGIRICSLFKFMQPDKLRAPGAMGSLFEGKKRQIGLNEQLLIYKCRVIESCGPRE
jgi:hypothetical protein